MYAIYSVLYITYNTIQQNRFLAAFILRWLYMWIIRNPFIFGPLVRGGSERPLRETLQNDGGRDDKSKCFHRALELSLSCMWFIVNCVTKRRKTKKEKREKKKRKRKITTKNKRTERQQRQKENKSVLHCYNIHLLLYGLW